MSGSLDPHPETGARSLAPPGIVPVVTNNSNVLDRVITPYRADTFEVGLLAFDLLEKHAHLPNRLRYGFPIGDDIDDDVLQRSYTPSNYAKHPDHLKFIREYVEEQVSQGRVTGPYYTKDDVEAVLGSFFTSSPLFVVDKAGSPGKYRLIQNFSHENRSGFSVNDLVDPDDYPTTWGSAAEMAQIVATACEGAQAACMDIDSAYRNIPIKPEHKRYLVLQLTDTEPHEFYIDHVCPFGIATGTGLQGQIMDAIVDLLEACDIGPIKKWVDDMIVIRYPEVQGGLPYTYDMDMIFELTRELGVPWKRGKCFDFSSSFVYVGFLWNLRNHSVSLPNEKREKYIAKLMEFLVRANTSPISRHEAMSIMGMLSHLTFVYTDGRAYLVKLSEFIASFPDSSGPQCLSAPVQEDILWWYRRLTSQVSRVLSPRLSAGAPVVWVDASSSWGIGIIIDERWFSWELLDGWNSNERDINWAEMIALELAALYLEHMNYANLDVVVRCDNQGVIGAFKKGKSRNAQVNLSIRRTQLVCMRANLGLLPEYVNTAANEADAISRGVPGAYARHLFELPRSMLPGELRRFLKHGHPGAYFPAAGNVSGFRRV